MIEVCRQIADNACVRRFDRESVMLGDEQASSLVRLFADGGRLPTSRSACTRLISACSSADGWPACVVLDTFDLVEQALGQQIHLPAAV